MTEPIRAFISYSGDDWESFVKPFATLLRNNGIDAVAANWDVHGGESLVQRILNEEIPRAEAIVIVLSKSSVSKPWVKEELDHATVRRINGQVKLIPLKIDDCDVPSSLETLKRISIKHLGERDAKVQEVIDSIYGHSRKPPLGHAPRYVTDSILFPEITPLESKVLEQICSLAFDYGYYYFDGELLYKRLEKLSITSDQADKAVDRLKARHLIDADRYLSGPYATIRLTPRTSIDYCHRTFPEYRNVKRGIAAQAVNVTADSFWEFRHPGGDTAWLVYKSAVDDLASQRLLSIEWAAGQWGVINRVSPLLEEWLDQN